MELSGPELVLVTWAWRAERLQVVVRPLVDDQPTGPLVLPIVDWDKTERPEQSARRYVEEHLGATSVLAGQVETLRDARRGVVVVVVWVLIRDWDQLGDHRLSPVKRLTELGPVSRMMVQTGYGRLQELLASTNAARWLMPPQFTLASLRRLYEEVLGRELDPANFHRRCRQLDLVTATGRLAVVNGGRSPELFRFTRSSLGQLRRGLFG